MILEPICHAFAKMPFHHNVRLCYCFSWRTLSLFRKTGKLVGSNLLLLFPKHKVAKWYSPTHQKPNRKKLLVFKRPLRLARCLHKKIRVASCVLDSSFFEWREFNQPKRKKNELYSLFQREVRKSLLFFNFQLKRLSFATLPFLRNVLKKGAKLPKIYVNFMLNPTISIVIPFDWE